LSLSRGVPTADVGRWKDKVFKMPHKIGLCWGPGGRPPAGRNSL